MGLNVQRDSHQPSSGNTAFSKAKNARHLADENFGEMKNIGGGGGRTVKAHHKSHGI